MPEFTVIMTHYNRPKVAGLAIKSILNQTFKDFELLIFDDGSELGPPDIPDDSRISLTVLPEMEYGLRKTTTRYAVLNNLGLSKASGKYVSYLTHDGLYFPGALETYISFFQAHPLTKITYGSQIIQQNISKQWVTTDFRIYSSLVLSPLHRIDHDQVAHHTDVRTKVQWPTHKDYWRDADGHFFSAVISHFGPMQRVDTYAPTTIKRIYEDSVTNQLNSGSF